MSEVRTALKYLILFIIFIKESVSGLLLTRRELVDHGGRYYHQEETSNILCSSHRQERDDLVVMVNHETRGW
jgi:hypothetical protein